ncbi:unnamed protein product [Cylicocyclus nassatus]|uniref:Uncharacterized protein n=1 Tax=Cylicocyclus nassatus TaxID=53992 RepID=A0AA36GZR8_CYLNA|nr:unnamed protein product [Cylicocyclus nassatus]
MGDEYEQLGPTDAPPPPPGAEIQPPPLPPPPLPPALPPPPPQSFPPRPVQPASKTVQQSESTEKREGGKEGHKHEKRISIRQENTFGSTAKGEEELFGENLDFALKRDNKGDRSRKFCWIFVSLVIVLPIALIIMLTLNQISQGEWFHFIDVILQRKRKSSYTFYVITNLEQGINRRMVGNLPDKA